MVMALFKRLRTKLGLRRNKAPKLNPYAVIGRYTYGANPDSIYDCGPNAPFKIGSFCSIAAEVVFLCRGQHPMETASSFPMSTIFPEILNDPDLQIGRTGIHIGNDVWVGRKAIILPQVNIGNGAVVGAGSIVTKDIPPYAIVAGNPAKIIRYRFDETTIAKLEAIAWWEWSDEKLKRHLNDFFLPIEHFVNNHHETDTNNLP